jgi:cysteine desulfurase / selenocysteine lyase
MSTIEAVSQSAAAYDVQAVRRDFPILWQTVASGKPLVYLDNAASTQKPQAMIDAVRHYYERDHANVHRGVHTLSERATAAFEGARGTVARYLNARSEREIVFVRGATEGINLITNSWGRRNVREGDEVVISAIEHHSNIVPWQMLCDEKGAKLRVIPVDDAGALILEEYEKLLTDRTRIVAVTHISNALGTVNPLPRMIAAAHERGIPVMIDGAQGVPHARVDVQELDVDFYIFSGHKVFAPTGIGIVYGKERLLEEMPPWQGGGDMILSVTFEKTTYNDLPFKFEAGTPNIAGAIGLAAALDYLSGVGIDRVAAHETDLLRYATEKLSAIPQLRIIGTAPEKASVISFVLEGIHPHDIGTIVDQEGVAIRTGHHCAQPLMQRYGLAATARASIALYNTREDIDALVRSIDKVLEVFA